jgi:hypothetical protein
MYALPWLLLGVVLLFVDIFAQSVLLSIDLRFFLRGELAAVSHAIIVNFLVQPVLFILQVSGLLRGELAGLNSLSDSLLLIFPALLNPAFLPGDRGIVRWDCEHCNC